MPAIDLPYFDLLLANRAETAARVFESYVHWGFWENPAKATRDLGEFSEAMERLNTKIVDAAGVDDGQTVLDAGCGFGGTLASIGRRFKSMDLTGLNIDARQLKLARLQVPGPRFVEGDACALPFPDASFDRVVAVECIFHFPSRAKFLGEAARVLKPGGRISLSDFVPADPGSRATWLGKRIEAVIAKGYGSSGDGWRDGNYAKMAASAGLKIELDRDITKNTLPTYPILLDLIGAGAAGGLMRWPTRLLMWLSRLGVVRYRIVSFVKPA